MSELAPCRLRGRERRAFSREPNDARFDAFGRSFDEAAYRRRPRRARAPLARRAPTPGFRSCSHDPRPAAGLFLRGDAAAARPTGVAIVGARACSPYGSSRCARRSARELAAAGAVVVSGLARGVDGGAHRGALEAGGRQSPCSAAASTVTTRAPTRELAAPVRGERPRRLRVRAWCRAGAVALPGPQPDRRRPGQATLVVEARERSGALITADLALDEGREVLAVPGEITSALSRGTNHLLRLGAVPVTCLGDALAVLGLDPAPRRHRHRSTPPRPVQAAIADAPVSADEIARRTGLSAGAVRGARRARARRGGRAVRRALPGGDAPGVTSESIS